MEVGLVEEEKQVERDEESERERSQLRWAMFFQPVLRVLVFVCSDGSQRWRDGEREEERRQKGSV